MAKIFDIFDTLFDERLAQKKIGEKNSYLVLKWARCVGQLSLQIFYTLNTIVILFAILGGYFWLGGVFEFYHPHSHPTTELPFGLAENYLLYLWVYLAVNLLALAIAIFSVCIIKRSERQKNRTG